MKTAVLGVLAGLGLTLIALAGPDRGNEAWAQRAGVYQGGTPGNEILVIPLGAADKHQMLAVVDPRQRVMGVYQVDPGTGKIALWSVRNLQWDLQMTEFNTGNPPPREIRALLEQR